jgi:tRNA dimethylallyltransferase
MMRDIKTAYHELLHVDLETMRNIKPTDSYRIEKMMLIYKASGITPSQWFKNNPAKPVITNLPIFEIDVSRDILKKRIIKRTQKMVSMGLIDEVSFLEQKYTREPNAMGAIGIIEVLQYLDGEINKERMVELIATHTMQLAKRQQTFNRSQFTCKTLLPLTHIIAEAEQPLMA